MMLVDGPPSPIASGPNAGFARKNVIDDINGYVPDSNCKANELENCGYGLAEYLANNDASGDYAGDQIIKTHAIHFGQSSVRKEVFPRGIADAGDGFYFSAATGAELEGALNALADGLDRIDTSFVSAGITVNQSNRLTHRDELYFSLFRPEAVASWPGNVKRYRIFDGVIYDNTSPTPISAILPAEDIFDENAQSWWSAAADGNDAGIGGAAGMLIFANDRNTFSNLTGDSGITASADNLVKIANTTPGGAGGTWETLLGFAAGNTAASDAVLNWKMKYQ